MIDFPAHLAPNAYHSPVRMAGPDYSGRWDGKRNHTHLRIIAWVTQLLQWIGLRIMDVEEIIRRESEAE